MPARARPPERGGPCAAPRQAGPARRAAWSLALFSHAAWLVALIFLGVVSAPAHAEKPVFRHPFDGQPIEVPEAKAKTPALERFKQTGENAYRDDAAAIGQGKALYEQWCQVCHNADGSGRMCPALIGSDHVYPQTSTDPGMFAILYAGASGAMQSFADRLSQDEMLRVIAYVRTLSK